MSNLQIEQITCICGEVIAGCVQGEQDARWNVEKQQYLLSGCKIDIVPVDNFKFGKCICEERSCKMRFKVMREPPLQLKLF